uniref:hypothetical protein n=1 Tax=Roseovarius indicus TaxID=540747 RepID=UPI003B5245F3
MRALAVCLGLLAGAPALAQEAVPCEWAARADNIAEPWEANTRTFSEGKVRLALLDTTEPAAAAFHILILSPPYDELGLRQCRTLGLNGMGFAGADFGSLDASYDPAVGLIFIMNVQVYDGMDYTPRTLRFTLNQATGVIGAKLLP